MLKLNDIESIKKGKSDVFLNHTSFKFSERRQVQIEYYESKKMKRALQNVLYVRINKRKLIQCDKFAGSFKYERDGISL